MDFLTTYIPISDRAENDPDEKVREFARQQLEKLLLKIQNLKIM